MNTELRIAVIGAGPAGVYSSDIFLRQLKKLGEELGLGTEARIDLFEKLPVPFGLVRYGVAPDHPSIKFIASALEKTLDNPNIHLYCDVEFGKDVTLDDLLARYDAVLFATGAVKDKPLNLPGADLEGVYGAAKFVEWYDGYPTGAREWPLTAENVAVIGGGNVAMDVARELMRNADDLKAKTDIPDNVYEGIGQNKAKVLHLFIRRGVAQAKFSVQELREMEKLPGVQLIINEDDFDLDDETIEVAGKDKLTRQMVEELFAVREMAEDLEDDGDVDFEGNPADRKYYVHFNSAPTEILGEDGKVKAIRVERTETGADGKMHRTGEFTDYPVEAVYHAIGYKPAEAPGITYDEHGAHLANANGDGRITTEADGGKVRDRLYATGWAKRGPVGLIGSTKSDALAIVTNMLEDLAKALKVAVWQPTATPNPSTDCWPSAAFARSTSPAGRRSTLSSAPRVPRKAASTRRSSSPTRCASSPTPDGPPTPVRHSSGIRPAFVHPAAPRADAAGLGAGRAGRIWDIARGAYPAIIQPAILVCALWMPKYGCTAISTA